MVSPAELEHIEYERRGDVGIWRTTDFAALFDSGEVATAEQHYREEASDDAMAATIVVIEGADELGADLRDTLDHINDQWSQLADEVDVDRVAYVAEGLMSWTVQSKIESEAEAGSFDSVDEALEWARAA